VFLPDFSVDSATFLEKYVKNEKKLQKNLEVIKKCVPLQSQNNKAVVVKW
jgi:hypothetical protein